MSDFFNYWDLVNLKNEKGDRVEIIQRVRTPGDRELGIPDRETDVPIPANIRAWTQKKDYTAYALSRGLSDTIVKYQLYIMAADPADPDNIFSPEMITPQTRVRVNGGPAQQLAIAEPILYEGVPKIYVYNLSETTDSERHL